MVLDHADEAELLSEVGELDVVLQELGRGLGDEDVVSQLERELSDGEVCGVREEKQSAQTDRVAQK